MPHAIPALHCLRAQAESLEAGLAGRTEEPLLPSQAQLVFRESPDLGQ